MQANQSTELLFEISHAGRRCHRLSAADVPVKNVAALLPKEQIKDTPPPLPEVGEIDLIRHFVNLSKRNMSIDTNFYPLGSCTMKYNPKRHERLAALPGLANVHPLQLDASCQGMLRILWEMQSILGEIAGLDAVSLQPAAGAQGELTALLVAAAYFRDKGEQRTKVLIPDSAHGTNPASAAIAGFDTVDIKSNDKGIVDLADLNAKLDERTAVFMITNPNTLGLFDTQIAQITKLLHEKGALVYLDGANMNAIVGVTRPGDFGADMMHYNVHKTFTGPHGAGGPGSGPIAVRSFLAPFLPAPLVAKDGDQFRLDYDRPKSIGRVRSFFGNVGILLRGYFYIRTLGPDGLRAMTQNAVLNANYLLARINGGYEVPHGHRCMHEFVASARALKREKRISAMDIAKRLLDFGYHAPTVYFPLVVPEAIMIEPTETESKETLDAFADTLLRICDEDAECLHQAPHALDISRPDEIKAAKEPILRWKP
ncbi:MAG: aminomethyl-transferring glycine dehydrogenase subunit GcvPB [Gemmataceae bacterium]|nr:aminomethyl-transferring glycine dehydrogenase subunit GcvPB [Gemmataceae bacterium]MCI0741960.1 aminomethyl-transferring glycine dehydrogenase subunit GcvPB [Gemmataceae bacterium]